MSRKKQLQRLKPAEDEKKLQTKLAEMIVEIKEKYSSNRKVRAFFYENVNIYKL